MTLEWPIRPAQGTSEASDRLAQLREVLALVEQLAGRSSEAQGATLNEGATLSSAYEDATPIARKRFDALVAETTAWASAGVEALAAAGDAGVPKPAAATLAEELSRALRRLSGTLTA